MKAAVDTSDVVDADKELPKVVQEMRRQNRYHLDLQPVFWTTDDWKIPVMMGGPEREAEDEGIEVLGGADCLCSAPG